MTKSNKEKHIGGVGGRRVHRRSKSMRENRLKNGRGGTPTKLMEDGEQKRQSRGRKTISANVNAEEQQRQSI